MKEACREHAEFTAWVNKEERIVTFRETDGFEIKIGDQHGKGQQHRNGNEPVQQRDTEILHGDGSEI